MERRKRKTVAQVDFPGGGGSVAWVDVTGKPSTFPPDAHTHPTSEVVGLDAALSGKQDTLVSGTNIKTVNGSSLLGAGNLVVSASLNAGQAVLDFGTYGEDATVDVIGQTSILSGSRVFVSIAAVDTAENTIDDIFADPPQILVGNIIPSTGFTIYGRALDGGLHGKININWNWI